MPRFDNRISWFACLSLTVACVLVLAPRPSHADACAADVAQVRLEGMAWTTENPTAPAWNIVWDARPASSAADHVLGTGNATAWAWCSPDVGGYVGESRLEFTDDFTLVGPGADPVAITAVASVHMVIGPGLYCYFQPGEGPICVPGYGAAEAGLHAGAAQDSVAWSSATPTLVDRDLGVAITAVPGVPFRVTVIDRARSRCGASLSTSTSHVLRFDGVPAGCSIISCKGPSPVPVRASTWGHLKAIYR